MANTDTRSSKIEYGRLRRTRGYVNFFAAATSARVADEMFSVAVVLHVLDRTGSAVIAGATVACVTFPSLITAPLLGGWLDLTGRRRFAMVCDQLLAASGLTLLLVLPGSMPDAAIPALGLVVGLTYPLSFGGFTSLIPQVVPEDLLAPANALEATSFNTALIAGPAIAGTVVAVFGPAEAVVLEIALTLAALVLILRIPGLDRAPRSDFDSLRQIVRAGLSHLAHTPPLLGATLIGAIGLGGIGLLTIAFPFFAVEHLDSGRGAAGYLWAAFAGGSAVGAVAFTGLQRRYAPERIMVVAIGVLGLVMLTWPLAGTLPAAVALIALGGLADGPALAATFAVRQQHTPRHLHGQVMTTAVGFKIGAVALGAGTAGILVESLDSGSVVLIAALMQFVAVAAGWLAMRSRSPVAVLR
ncbi:MAG TPA: MFS transporter [Thermoleophilaceae bacterium]|nr:MFS transporter [Thermoleophilaceae bacterium]